MKSKTSLFNWTIFRKDITRFFPAWMIFSVIQLIAFDNRVDITAYSADRIADAISSSSIISFVYAPIVCVLLFGDLYKSRLCNGIHALPFSRPILFCTHTVAALCFYIVPNAVIALLQLLFLRRYWYISLFWLLGSTLIYVCFLGFALLCTFVSGNRFAAISSYLLLMSMPSIADFLRVSLYGPLLEGVYLDTDFFARFSPDYALNAMDYIRVEFLPDTKPWTADIQILAADWGALCLWTAVGVAAGTAALLLYRRRHLETAGDFITVKALHPVFLVMYSLVACLILLPFVGATNVFIGLILGFFTGLMLLKRSRHVFTKKAWIGLGVLLAGILLIRIFVSADAQRLNRWIPEEEDVKQVRLSSYGFEEVSEYTLELNTELISLRDEQGISDAIDFHRYAKNSDTLYDSKTVGLNIEYTLKDGTVRSRHYRIPIQSPQGQLYRQYLSRPEALFGEDPEGFLSHSLIPKINDHPLTLEEQETVKQLLLEDCQAGYMAQSNAFRSTSPEFKVLLQHSDGSATIRVNDPQGSLYLWIIKNGYSQSANK